MKRTMFFLLGAASAVTLLASAACSSKDDGGGGSGNTGNATTTTATGSGGCDCYSCSGYIAACFTQCPGDPRDVVCQGSLATMAALNECICDPARGNCAPQCAGTCSMSVGGAGGVGGMGGAGGGGGTVSGGGTDSGSGGDSADCIPCQAAAVQSPGGKCSAEIAACAALGTCG